MKVTEQIGRVVRNQRKLQGLTQRELGEYSSCGLNFISQLERGKSTVRLDKLLMVLKVLGVQCRLERGKDLITVDRELGE